MIKKMLEEIDSACLCLFNLLFFFFLSFFSPGESVVMLAYIFPLDDRCRVADICLLPLGYVTDVGTISKL